MNSLVVLLSVVALASAVPSGGYYGALPYSANVIAAAPAAVSSQSRLDIKSSPAFVATSYSAPAIAAPVAYSAPAAVGYATPAVAAPIAYSSGAAVSSQSRFDIKSSPAVVSTSYSAPAIAAPVAYSAPATIAAKVAYSAPAVGYTSGSAVSSQSRLDIKSSPAIVSTSYSAPAIAAPVAYAAPAAFAARLAYSAPAVGYTSGSAVSSQSRLDIKSSPAIVSTSYSAPAIAAPVAYAAPAAFAARLAYSAPAVGYTSGSAVSSQSRLDIKSSPAIVSTSYSAPAIAAPVAYAAPTAYAARLAYSAPAVGYTSGSAVSSQSRLDIKSSPAKVSTSYSGPAIAAPVAYAAPAAFAARLAYSAPAVGYTAGSAVSSQSRLDIKSSPAVVSTSYSAPAAIAAPVSYAAPAANAAPIAYSAPAVAYNSGSAVSSQSRLDVKSTPAFASTYVSAPQVYNAHIGTAAIGPAFVKTAFAAPAFVKSFAGPAATAFAAPSVIKSAAFVPAAIEAPAVPLDTPEVIAARAAHFEAKAIAEGHLIKKRSVYAAPLFSQSIATPVVSTYAAAPIYTSPLAYSTAYRTPIFTKAYGIHPW